MTCLKRQFIILPYIIVIYILCIGRHTRRAEAVRRVIANITEEERTSVNEYRQRIAQIRTVEAA